ncbi:hypothetical protein Plano_0573 [Planococcus sp. PAMC 21323]|uniref:CPBP family intramembrane glutamic endopeptidase n=1 Tax=Planococcus sp. PAMC 21323 TaxID=1526927 RepID=UPI00056F05C6|nr:CPBP family intramembrane glutamic endopeptidase [Planococcus sp. PAMC 21323]AIY04538.1 hypothetical protein Plano_0573 [Planococcus sp. PAMC 21323]
MNTEKRSQRFFIGFVFIWSFVFWGIGIFLSLKDDVQLLENMEVLLGILNLTLSEELRTVTILYALAGYGPLLGAIFITLFIPETRRYFKGKFRFNTPLKYTFQIIALFAVITIVPGVTLVFKNGLDTSVTWSTVALLLLFFIYQLITAGTEEIGWRGYLLPSMLQKLTPWQASVRIGVIWALWHTPIILYVFYSQGLPVFQIIFSFAGFIAGTIAMSAVHTYYYLKTQNVVFNMFIHAVSNTFPMFVGMVLSSSYEVSVVTQLLLWVFVGIIIKKNKVFFDTVQNC